MNAYVWLEGQGDRGANNITSCLYKDFKARGYFNQRNYGSLTIIADNCAGQNKNKHVVRFLMSLVELKWFPQITLIFLIKGHTKNACDRLFNLVKLNYHRKNIFDYNDLVDNLNNNKFISASKVKPEEFKDHLKWQDQLYRTPASGDFTRTHIFTIKSDNPTVLIKQDHDGAEMRYENLLPTRRSRKALQLTKQERIAKLKLMENDIETLAEPGIRAIKQVELYQKWRPPLPVEKRDLTCPKPADEILKKVRDERRTKAATNRKRKKPEDNSNCSDAVYNI